MSFHHFNVNAVVMLSAAVFAHVVAAAAAGPASPLRLRLLLPPLLLCCCPVFSFDLLVQKLKLAPGGDYNYNNY